jgi:REP element-mobilizing transposase RayT
MPTLWTNSYLIAATGRAILNVINWYVGNQPNA